MWKPVTGPLVIMEVDGEMKLVQVTVEEYEELTGDKLEVILEKAKGEE